MQVIAYMAVHGDKWVMMRIYEIYVILKLLNFRLSCRFILQKQIAEIKNA